VTFFAVGGTTFDLLASGLQELPRADSAGDEFTDRSLVHLPQTPVTTVGGNAGNAAYALARLGCPVHLVTPLAEDLFGRQLCSWLAEAGCQVWALPASETSINVVATDLAYRRVSFFRPVEVDAAAALDALDRLPLASGDHVLLTGYPHPPDEVLLAWASRARHVGASVALDIGPGVAGLTISRLVPLLSTVDVLFGTRAEVSMVDVRSGPDEMADRLAMMVLSGLVVKDGAAGAEFRSPRRRVRVPAFPVDAASSVGAGDVFDAAYIAAEATDPARRLRFAAAAAALMLHRRRGVRGTPSRADIEKFLQTERTTSERPAAMGAAVEGAAS
jgi:sugar/nucleoside kinase (ribokinase family)